MNKKFGPKGPTSKLGKIVRKKARKKQLEDWETNDNWYFRN